MSAVTYMKMLCDNEANILVIHLQVKKCQGASMRNFSLRAFKNILWFWMSSRLC